MSYLTEHVRENASMFLPIPAADRQQALEFARQQITAEAQQQAYHNRLAVLVTHRYLDLLGIESDLQRSQGQQPVAALSANLADLYIPEARGRLECRAVAADAQKCFVPEETWANRLGFVIVQLNATYTVATLLGFVPEVRMEQLPLGYLQPLEALFAHLTPPTWNLSQWLAGQLDQDWELLPHQTIQTIQTFGQTLMPAGWNYRSTQFQHQTEPELAQIVQTTQNEEERWDAAERLHQLNPTHPDAGLWAVDLAVQISGHAVALLVAILAVPQGTAILIRLYPTGRPDLPPGLRLVGRSGQASLFDLVARSESRGLQYRFLADRGDQFQIQISLDTATITEYFVV